MRIRNVFLEWTWTVGKKRNLEFIPRKLRRIRPNRIPGRIMGKRKSVKNKRPLVRQILQFRSKGNFLKKKSGNSAWSWNVLQWFQECYRQLGISRPLMQSDSFHSAFANLFRRIHMTFAPKCLFLSYYDNSFEPREAHPCSLLWSVSLLFRALLAIKGLQLQAICSSWPFVRIILMV